MTHLKASAAQVGWVPLAVGWVSAAVCSEVAGRMGCEVPCTHLQERKGSPVSYQPWSHTTVENKLFKSRV